MDTSLDHFVVWQNIARFRSQLENGAEGNQRETLLKLLVEQEGFLGPYEYHQEITAYIVKLKEAIRTQLRTIALLKAQGQPIAEAEKKLCRLLDLLIVHERQLQIRGSSSAD